MTWKMPNEICLTKILIKKRYCQCTQVILKLILQYSTLKINK